MPTSTHSIDSSLLIEKTKVFSINGHLGEEIHATHGVNAYLVVEKSTTHSINGFILTAHWHKINSYLVSDV